MTAKSVKGTKPYTRGGKAIGQLIHQRNIIVELDSSLSLVKKSNTDWKVHIDLIDLNKA